MIIRQVTASRITLLVLFMDYYTFTEAEMCPDYDASGNQCSYGCCWRRHDADPHCCSWAESVGDVVLALIGVASSLAVVTILLCIVCRFVKSKGHPGEIISSPGQSRLGTASGSELISSNNTSTVISEHRTHDYRPSINRNSQSIPRENTPNASQSDLNGITRNVASGRNNTSCVSRGNRNANLPTISEYVHVSDTVTPPAYNTSSNQSQIIDISEQPPSYDSLFKDETTAVSF